MGNRNRPALYVDESVDRHVNVMVTRAMPISLTPAKLALERHPPQEAEPGQGVAVSAWVRFPETPVLATAWL
ncbi:MAG TPA: hypothetical protein VEX88_04460 [Glaciibacter sp.]|nr:hypothetical protein [Glaciibacter sp.]